MVQAARRKYADDYLYRHPRSLSDPNHRHVTSNVIGKLSART